MSKDTELEHNPGSPEAVKRGCTCAVWDNNHGIGFCYGGEERCFYVTQDCPLHDYPLHGFPEKVENRIEDRV